MTDRKHDYINPAVDLYVALSELVFLLNSGHKLGASESKEMALAETALEQFELYYGPLPIWASGFNFKHALIDGAQLLTKDGRKCGNAVITYAVEPIDETHQAVYQCVTDAGNAMTLTAAEVEELFYVGKFIMKDEEIQKTLNRSI